MAAKKLGFGLMRLPQVDSNDPQSIDIEAMKRMVDLFIERGFTYFDTAYPYHGGKSELAFRETVSRRYPREAFTVTDKMPCWDVNSADDLERIFNEQLEKCGVDYFDYYWLHALNKSYLATMERVGGFDFIVRKAAEGKIKHPGFSFHDDSATLEKILHDHAHQVEIVQLQINYLDWEDPAIEARRCYEICERYGKKVVVMEPVKGGSLAHVPDAVAEMMKRHSPQASPASWALRYAASLPNVMMVLSGMSNLAQVDDNTAVMKDFAPLDDEERAIINTATGIIKDTIAVPCTACHYCTDGCPMNIAIPEYFAIYNTIKQFGKEQQWMDTSTYFSNLSHTRGVPSACIQCGQCEEHCPQHISIIANLQKVAEVFEN